MTFGLDLVKDHELALVYDGHSFVWRYLSLRNIESSAYHSILQIEFLLLEKHSSIPSFCKNIKLNHVTTLQAGFLNLGLRITFW